MPLLERAKHVTLISVNARPGTARHGDTHGADIGLHLARHGVRVEVRNEEADEAKPADLVLNAAADQDMDLIVMGAYGHSRMREFVLGGMTRSMLDHMTVPVLMSH
jgi:nucleotide-binding universal stress UspA family protein